MYRHFSSKICFASRLVRSERKRARKRYRKVDQFFGQNEFVSYRVEEGSIFRCCQKENFWAKRTFVQNYCNLRALFYRVGPASYSWRNAECRTNRRQADADGAHTNRRRATLITYQSLTKYEQNGTKIKICKPQSAFVCGSTIALVVNCRDKENYAS